MDDERHFVEDVAFLLRFRVKPRIKWRREDDAGIAASILLRHLKDRGYEIRRKPGLKPPTTAQFMPPRPGYEPPAREDGGEAPDGPPPGAARD